MDFIEPSNIKLSKANHTCKLRCFGFEVKTRSTRIFVFLVLTKYSVLDLFFGYLTETSIRLEIMNSQFKELF
jgi:hypothetical protein